MGISYKDFILARIIKKISIAPTLMTYKKNLTNNRMVSLLSLFMIFLGIGGILVYFINNHFHVDRPTIYLLNNYISYIIIFIVSFFWSLYLKHNPEKMNYQVVQPLHFCIVGFLLMIIYIFCQYSNINAAIVFLTVVIIAPIAFFLQPIFYNTAVNLSVAAIIIPIYREFGSHTVFNTILFTIALNTLTITRWINLVNSYLYEEKLMENIKEMDKEIALASTVQNSFFKHNEIPYKGWYIVCYNKAMAGVSGDFYDLYDEDGNLEGLGIFDVSGHGISSGLVTMLVKNIINSEFYKGIKDDLKTVLQKINYRVIHEKGGVENYLTGILARITGNNIDLVMAAHPLPIVFNAKNQTLEYLDNGSQVTFGAIGMENVPSSYSEYYLHMNSGDELFFYTDGITDAINYSREAFGKERLLKSVKRNIDRPIDTQINCIISDVQTFTKGMSQNDDITLVILKKK